uniref:Innexin n=1 Tax=Ditylenchus dipsaci TaxID=166011 RepID=A0A915CRN6_9BILA
MFSLDRRRQLAPRTSEEEALFIAQQYAENKLILEAKLANSVNGGRAIRQTMLDKVAGQLSQNFNVARRSRKYVEQKLRDMKKEARKFVQMQQRQLYSEHGEDVARQDKNARTPSEPIRVMIEAMHDELECSSQSMDSLRMNGTLQRKEYCSGPSPSSLKSKVPESIHSIFPPEISVNSFSSNNDLNCKKEFWQCDRNIDKLMSTPQMMSHAMAAASWFFVQEPQKLLQNESCFNTQSKALKNLLDNYEPMTSTKSEFINIRTGCKMKLKKCGKNGQDVYVGTRSTMSSLRRELMQEKIKASRAFSSLCNQIEKSVEAIGKELTLDTQSICKTSNGCEFPYSSSSLVLQSHLSCRPVIRGVHANLCCMWASQQQYGERAAPLTAAGRAVAPDMFFQATLARSFIHSLKLRGDDDFVDRLNYYYTPIMLAVACLIISAKQYGGTPIECWVNPHSRESMEEYIESFCWIQNTYWVPMYEHIPDSHEAREEQQIGYYQWVPFILIAEALMFSLPCILWRLLNWQSGLNIQNVISAATEARSIIDQSERDKIMHSVSQSFIDIIDLQDTEIRPHPSSSWIGRLKCNRVFRGHYITALYLFIKLCYTVNILLQFALLNAALKSGEHLLFGFQVLSDLIAGKPWTKSGHFPRVTLCDFEVRYLANLNRYTVQCALLINIINEKVFAFFWLWYLVLLIITSASTLFWLTNCLLVSERVDYVLKFMQIAESSDRKRCLKGRSEDVDEMRRSTDLGTGTDIFRLPDSYLLNKFVLEFLQSDGTFALRFIANHAGELVVVSIVRALWKEFYERNWREIEEFESVKHQQHNTGHSSRRRSSAYTKIIVNKSLGLRKPNNSMKPESIVMGITGVPKLTDSMISEDKIML